MQYAASDEVPHPPLGGDERWQESNWIFWGDGAGWGGMLHLGQEPNRGLTSVWCSVANVGARFRRGDSEVRLEHGDRDGERFGYGPAYRLWHTGDGVTYVEVDDHDCRMSLVLEDLYPMIPLWKDPDALSEQSAFHFECSAQIKGNVHLGTLGYEVDGLAQRGHSWGHRDLSPVRSERFVCSFGPELSFAGITHVTIGRAPVEAGFVVRDGEPLWTTNLDVVAHVEMDGLTVRGGTVAFELPGDERLEVVLTIEDGGIFEHDGLTALQSVGTCMTDGFRDEFAAFEFVNRPLLPGERASCARRAAFVDGLETRESRA